MAGKPTRMRVPRGWIRSMLISPRCIATISRAMEGRMLLEVADQGKGIPDDLAEQVMEPFFTTKPQGQGSGLGLALAREIVHMHRGEISIERALPRGTRIRVALPA